MDDPLERFVTAQQESYARALQEIANGKKLSHWMWYIFPQIAGLGHSETARYYTLEDLAEAQVFLQHHILGKRLLNSTEATLVQTVTSSASALFGHPDDLKFRSSLTLFQFAVHNNPQFSDSKYLVFQRALDHFFDGKPDVATVEIILRSKKN